MYHDYIVLTSHLAIRDTKTPPPLLAHYHMTRPTRNLIIYIAGPNLFSVFPSNTLSVLFVLILSETAALRLAYFVGPTYLANYIASILAVKYLVETTEPEN